MILIYLKKLNNFLLYVAVVLLLAPQFLLAQAPSQSLSVSPTIFEMTADPRQDWQSSLRVINANPFELRVYTEVQNFKPLGEGGASEFIPIVDDPEGPSTFAEWIEVPSEAIVIPPEQTVQIPIKISLPDNAPPGGHYAAILVGTRPPESNTDQSRVETSQVVSSLLFLRVAGDINEQGNIRSFRTTNKLLDKPQAQFELRFENKGNVHLQPQGEITITNMWGQERGVIPVNQRTLFGNVLPNSVRNFSFTWTGEWSISDIGLYTAEATLAYGENDRQFASGRTTFWVIPWRIVTGVILSILLLFYVSSWLIRLYIRRMLKMAGVTPTHSIVKEHATVTPHRKVSVVAPIEAGILDLRSRFEQREDDESRIKVVITFVQNYKLFFIGAAIFLFVIYSLVWYFQNAFVSERSYEVEIQTLKEDVIINSEQIEFEQLVRERSLTLPAGEVKIAVVNRSGISGAAARRSVQLIELGYVVSEVSTEFGSIESRTVIVFDPKFEDEALALSEELDNALLSAYQNRNVDQPIIAVYLGADLAE